eukprot:TRINITY_DN5386_c0_g5_i1.p1 TRINITY_DN5386_c0_g5~~TRINITY_DN5386_c0_g5_i1.p1  ORF type:complete len:313 (-),score=84.22 TRINITY_DN5386_c0_g5_i1:276-1214(-)
MWENEQPKVTREKKLEKDLEVTSKKLNSTLQSARQIFSIAVSCIQRLSDIKDNNYLDADIATSIGSFKTQLGKYHKILLTEDVERCEMFTEAVILEHKKKLLSAKEENDVEGLIEVLMSLRVNALQILPELRRSLVNELVRNDIFLITANKSNALVLDLLGTVSHGLKHATCALLSVLSSTQKGVDYLADQTTIQKLAEVLKEQEDGSVTQRFSIAALQKMSIKEKAVEVLVKGRMIEWIVKLLERSLAKDVHVFVLDFGSALLANVLRSRAAAEELENDPELTKSVSFTVYCRLFKDFLCCLNQACPHQFC